MSIPNVENKGEREKTRGIIIVILKNQKHKIK